MEKARKIKLFIGLFYLILVSLFLYFFFSKFTIQEVTSFEFIKNNRDYFFELKKSNLILLAILFIVFVIFWVLVGGFGTPVALLSGFIFGKWFGTLFIVIGMTIGATLLYMFANYFFKDFIKEKFLKKFQYIEEKFKKSEFTYLLIYRFIGGIPFAISNVLPCMFNVKASNFFFASLFGLTPQLFLAASIGSGVEKIIDRNLEAPSVIDLIVSKDIYIPLIIFACLIIILLFLRKLFYKK